MKASLTLPERPSALYLVAVLDVLVVLLVFFTLIPVVAQQSGMQVELVEMSSRLSSLDLGKSVALTIKPGYRDNPPQYYLNARRIAYEDLKDALEEAREEAGVRTVIVSADKRLQLSVIEITLVIDNAGLIPVFLGALPGGDGEEARENPPQRSRDGAADDAPQP